MANRRDFIKGSLMAAVAPAVPTFVLGRERPQFYKVVYDERFIAGRAFAAQAKRSGAAVHGIRGNITDLWFHDLSRRWKHGPAAIAGLTTYESMFLLQMMAQDSLMRVVYLAHHHRAANGAVKHSVFGPSDFLRGQPNLDESETNWAVAAATIVMSWPKAQPFALKSPTNIASAGDHALGVKTLVSWIIGPSSYA